MAKFDGSKFGQSANGVLHVVTRKAARDLTVMPTACRPEAGTAVKATQGTVTGNCVRCTKAVAKVVTAAAKPGKATLPSVLTRPTATIRKVTAMRAVVGAAKEHPEYKELVKFLKGVTDKNGVTVEGDLSGVWVGVKTPSPDVQIMIWSPQWDNSGDGNWIIQYGNAGDGTMADLRYPPSITPAALSTIVRGLWFAAAGTIDAVKPVVKGSRRVYGPARGSKRPGMTPNSK